MVLLANISIKCKCQYDMYFRFMWCPDITIILKKQSSAGGIRGVFIVSKGNFFFLYWWYLKYHRKADLFLEKRCTWYKAFVICDNEFYICFVVLTVGEYHWLVKDLLWRMYLFLTDMFRLRNGVVLTCRSTISKIVYFFLNLEPFNIVLTYKINVIIVSGIRCMSWK